MPGRRDGHRRDSVLGVAISTARRGIEGEIDLAVGHEHHEVVFEIRLDDVARCAAGLGHHTLGQGRLRGRTDDAAPADAGCLLQGPDRLLGAVSELAIRSPEPIPQGGQSLLQRKHGGPAGPRLDIRRRDLRAGQKPITGPVGSGRDRRHRVLQLLSAHGAEESSVAEAEHAAVGRAQPVAVSGRSCRHADDGSGQLNGAGGTEVARVAEAEHPTVGSHEPIATSVGGSRHADDGLAQSRPTHRPGIVGVAIGEDAAVRCHQPVTTSVGRGGKTHDGRAEADRSRGSEEPCITEAEHPAVRRHEPVTVTVGCRGHTHHRLGQPCTAHRPVGAGITEAEHPAVRRHEPVALGGRCRRHTHDGGVEGDAGHGSEEARVPERHGLGGNIGGRGRHGRGASYQPEGRDEQRAAHKSHAQQGRTVTQGGFHVTRQSFLGIHCQPISSVHRAGQTSRRAVSTSMTDVTISPTCRFPRRRLVSMTGRIFHGARGHL